MAVILPYTALGIPLSVFLLTGFFRNLPKELLEAATHEGANIILQFMYTWNEFALAPALLKKGTLFKLPLEICKVQGQYMTPWNIVATTVICAIVPVLIVYMIFQKQFIAGLTAGALKD